jgi:hypothetical protein
MKREISGVLINAQLVRALLAHKLPQTAQGCAALAKMWPAFEVGQPTARLAIEIWLAGMDAENNPRSTAVELEEIEHLIARLAGCESIAATIKTARGVLTH